MSYRYKYSVWNQRRGDKKRGR